MDFEIERIAELVEERKARVIRLQFPEGLKRYGPDVAKRIKRQIDVTVLLSGNPCYGACDLDYDAEADLLVHFGHAEIPELAAQRVHFVEVRSDVDVIPVVNQALGLIKGPRVGLVTNVQHVHTLGSVRRCLESAGLQSAIGSGDGRIKYPGQVLGCNFSSARAIDVDEYLYIGGGVFHALGVALATGKQVIAADPFLHRTSLPDANLIVKQRYALITKALDARTFCVLAGTKTGQRRLDFALELAQQAIERGYDAYTVTINELTPWTLYQFPAEAYVNTACPRVTIDDASRFKAPMLTPIEFEMVVGKRDLSEYALDEFSRS
ncbi:MAG: diphthamide biosynthesis enzyme Dph2 [Halobacteriota archaeon]|jgi:2-(3-amino-3-carboxypropyl)histidine synthase